MAHYAPIKVLDEAGLATGGRRFRFVPLHDRLRATTARPAALPVLPAPSSALADDTAFSHLRDALDRRRELDLTADFCAYAAAVAPLAASLPLVVHARARILACTLAALAPGTPAAAALVDCLHALARDLGADLFAPFLPEVADALARLLQSSNSSSKGGGGGGDADAQLWDPARTLEPALAALARIVKIIVQPLVRDPGKAIRALAPLLAHEHYRVRELSAEASAGYLLRKTRDQDALRALIDACVHLPGDASLLPLGTDSPEDRRRWTACAVHGTAAVLYEGARGVGGALHARATTIVSRALETVMPLEPTDPRLEAVCNAIAALCTHTANSKSSSGLFSVIISQADATLSGRSAAAIDSHAVANACFLLRKWCTHKHGAHLLLSTQIQRVLDFSVAAVATVADASSNRLTCESLGVITGVLSLPGSVTAAGRFRAMNQSARESLVCATRKVSPELAPVALQALRTAYDARAASLADILEAYAVICNRIANRADYAPMEQALLLLRRTSPTRLSSSWGHLRPALVEFDAPDIIALVNAALTRSLSRMVAGGADNSEADRERTLALEFCRLAVVPLVTCNALTAVMNGNCGDPTVAHRSAALEALVLQHTANLNSASCHVPTAVRRQVAEMICSNSDQLCVVRAMSMLLQDMQHDAALPATHTETDNLCQNPDRIVSSVCSNLASGNWHLRAHTALLLVRLESASNPLRDCPSSTNLCVSGDEEEASTHTGSDDAVNDSEIKQLQGSESSNELDDGDDARQREVSLQLRLESGIDTSAVYELLLKIQLTPLTVEHASTTQQRIVLLADLVRRRSPVTQSSVLRSVLANAAIGLFRVRFKLLWLSAGELWRSLAHEDSNVAWNPLCDVLLTTKRGILQQSSYRSTHEEDERDKKDSVDDDDENNNAEDEEDTSNVKEAETERLIVQEKVLLQNDLAVQCQSNRIGSEFDVYPRIVGAKRPLPDDGPQNSIQLPRGQNMPLVSEVNCIEIVDRPSKQVKKRMRPVDKSTIRTLWELHEWKETVMSSVVSGEVSEAGALAISSDFADDTTDAATLHLQLIKALCDCAELCMPQRLFLLRDLYLELDPDMLSRRLGISFAKIYSSLFEQLGGLRSTGDDKYLEDRFRARLLGDLCRPDSSLQAAVIKCLCVARSKDIKGYRESLLRVADDTTFRDELVVLTSRLRDSDALDGSRIEVDGGLEDVLVRLCFGKMRGRRDKIAARRGAALSFIVSSLNWSGAIPRLIKLSLGPLDPIVSRFLAKGEVQITSVSYNFSFSDVPPSNILRGVLASVDSIVRQFAKAVPESSWLRLTTAVLVILLATKEMTAKSVRTMAFRRLAAMVDRRPTQTEQVAISSILNVRRSKFDISSARDVTDAPGLLIFLAACSRAPASRMHNVLVIEEKQVMEWCIGIIESRRAQPRAIELALDVASLVPKVSALAVGIEESNHMTQIVRELFVILSVALRKRLQYLREINFSEDGKLGVWKTVLAQSMTLVSKLSTCVHGVEDAEALVDALADFVVAEIPRRSDITSSTLIALAALFRHLFSVRGPYSHVAEDTYRKDNLITKHAGVLARLFNDSSIRTSPEDRKTLCDVFASFGRDDLVAISNVLRLMGAMRADRVNEPDLDARASGLSAVCAALKDAIAAGTEIFFACKAPEDVIGRDSEGPRSVVCIPYGEEGSVALQAEGLMALVYGCVAAVGDSDAAARGMAGYALSLLAEWSVMSPCRCVIRDNFLDVLRLATVSIPGLPARREFARALGVIVRSTGQEWHPSALVLQGLRRLARNDDIDADFFENIAHIQPHRRSRALRRLTSVLENTSNHSSITETRTSSVVNDELRALATEFAMPLSYRIALDISEISTNASKHVKATEARNAASSDVYPWAAAACGSAAKHFPPSEYRKVLARLLHRLPREENETRLQSMYLVVVAVAESCPTFTDENSVEKEAMAGFLTRVALPSMMKLVNAGAHEGDVLTNVISEHSKHDRVGGHSAKSTGIVFRAQVAVAAARLMTKLPQNEMESMLPLLVTPVATALRSRMNDVRDSAKKALVQIALLFGSHYLAYIVDQILNVLSQGFRKDAGVYVLHSLLQGIQASRVSSKPSEDSLSEEVFSINSAAGLIADALAAEVVEGVHADAKGFDNPNVTSSRARDADRRAARAGDAAEILGELVCFKEMSVRVLKPFRVALLSASSSKLASRLRLSMQRMSNGLVRNLSLKPSDGLTFAYELVHDNMPAPCGAQEPVPANYPEPARVFSNFPQSYAVAEFGFQFLNSMLSKSIVTLEGTDDEATETLSMLEPFLLEASLALRSRFESLTLVALKAAQRLIRLPLRYRAMVANNITGTVLEVLSRSCGSRGVGSTRSVITTKNTSGADLFQTCLRSAAVIIQEVGRLQDGNVKDDLVRGIINIARESLTDTSVDTRTAALVFLRNVVNAKFVAPEVYDAVDDISKLAIRAQSASLQASCIGISVAFMVSYPLSSKRIRQQLEFFIRNLNYTHPDGRRAAVHAIATVIEKFPVASVNSECDFIFLPIAAVLGNDDDVACRESAANTLKSLFNKVSDGRKVVDLLGICFSLLGVQAEENFIGYSRQATLGFTVLHDSNPAAQRSGAGAIGAAAKSGALSMQQLHSSLRALLAVGMGGKSLELDTTWDIIHTALCSAEIVFDAVAAMTEKSEKPADQQRVETMPALRLFWNSVPELLQHEHCWVRVVVCRLVGRHFAALGQDVFRGSEVGEEERRNRGYSLFSCKQGGVRRLMKALCLVLEGAVLPDALAEQVIKNLLFIGKIMVLRPSVGDLVEVGTAESDEDEMAEQQLPETAVDRNRGLFWLLMRMSGIASRLGKGDHSSMRRASAMRFLAAAVASWDVESIRPYMRLLVGPVLRVLEYSDRDGKKRMETASPEVALNAMAMAVQDTLIKTLGADSYYAVYNEQLSKLRNDRMERKRKHAVESAVDPERATKRRLKRSTAKAEARRRNSASNFGARGARRVSKSSFAVHGGASRGLLPDD